MLPPVLVGRKGKVMMIRYAETIEQKNDPGRPLSRIAGWMGAMIAAWGKWGDLRVTQVAFDDMSDAQL